MSDKWMTVIEPKNVWLNLGVYRCPYCARPVMTYGRGHTESLASIEYYHYCPHCGNNMWVKDGGTNSEDI